MSLTEKDFTKSPAMTVEIPTYHSDTFKFPMISDTTHEDGFHSPPWSEEEVVENDWLGLDEKEPLKTKFSKWKEEVNIFEDSLENIRSHSPSSNKTEAQLKGDPCIIEPLKSQHAPTIAKFIKSHLELDCFQMG